MENILAIRGEGEEIRIFGQNIYRCFAFEQQNYFQPYIYPGNNRVSDKYYILLLPISKVSVCDGYMKILGIADDSSAESYHHLFPLLELSCLVFAAKLSPNLCCCEPSFIALKTKC